MYEAVTRNTLLYSVKRKDDYKSWQESVGTRSKNAAVYMGYASAFLVIWVLLFRWLPADSAWKEVNDIHFGSVTLILVLVILWASYRTRRALYLLPLMQANFVAYMLRSDPDMQEELTASEDRRREVWSRINELGSHQDGTITKPGPSLWKFLRFKLTGKRSVLDEADNGSDPTGPRHPRRARHNVNLYRRGERMAWDRRRNQDFNNEWLFNYAAYLYYRGRQFLSQVWQVYF